MHHLIFEGAELTGKSTTIYGVWNTLEKKYNSGIGVLDGCTWINADIGLFGTKDGWPFIKAYLRLFRSIAHRNIIVEKFHITNYIYTHSTDRRLFKDIEKTLADLHFKIILTTVQPDPNAIRQKLNTRLHDSPSYKRIAHDPLWYTETQEQYLKLITESRLPSITIDNSILPNKNSTKILTWLNE